MLRGEWEGALKALAEELELAASPTERAALYYLRGILFEQRAGRSAEARASYTHALEQLPGDAASLRALLRAARKERKPAEVRSLLERLAESAQKDGSLSASRTATRARVTEVGGGDTAEALSFYLRSVTADPLASASLAHAERLTTLSGDAQKLVELGQKRIELLSEPVRRAAAFLATAELCAERLGDRALAVSLLEQAAKEVPTDRSPLVRLSDLYHEQGDYTSELRTLLRLEELESERDIQVELRLRIAQLYRHRLDSLGDAIVWFEKARELAPAHPGAADSLAELYRMRGDWRGLAHVLAGREAACDDLQQRAALHLELAELFETNLGDRAAAITSLKAAVGLVPDHPGAFHALTRLLHQERRFPELVEVHEAAVDRAEDDAEAVSHLLTIGQVLEDLLSNPAGALAAYQRILERDPRHLVALRGVQRVAVTAEKPDVAISAFQTEAQQTKQAERKVPLLLRAAEIAERQVGSVEDATALYQQVIALVPSSRPALSALSRIYYATGNHKELISTMEAELSALPGRKARCEHQLRIGQVAEDLLSDEGLALEHYKKALTEDPDSQHAAACVQRALQRRGQREPLARHLENRLKHEKDEHQKVASAIDLARLYELRLDRPREALKAYETALEASPDNQVARDGRVRCLAVLGEHQRLAAALDELAQLPGDQATLMGALLLSAEVYEDQLEMPEEAIKRYEKVLEVRSGHRGALEGLERLYNQLGRNEPLRRVLKQQVAAYDPIEERIASLRELGRIAHSDEPEASTWRKESAARILELAPEDERALTSLELSSIETKNAASLASVDRVRVTTASAPDLRSSLRTRLGEFLEAQNLEHALALHRPALSEDPENIGAARGVTRLAEQLGRVDLLVEAAETESRVVQSPERVSSLFRRAAALENEAGRLDEAVRILKRCLSLHPDDAPSAQDLHRLLAADSRFEELIATLEQAATAAHNPEVRAGHWISVARLLAFARKDLPAAISALLRVEKAQPNHFPTLVELAELYIRDRQWQAAASRLEKALSITKNEQQAQQARLRLAEIYHEHLDRIPDATRLLREVLRADPGERSALRRLLYIEVETGKPTAQATAEAWAKVSSGEELAEALTTLGRLQRDGGQTDDALRSMLRAVEIVGYREKGASRDLVRLFDEEIKKGRKPDWSSYARALQAFCQSDAPANERASSYLELSRISYDRRDNPRDGEAALRLGLEVDPGNVSLLRKLCERLVAARDFERGLPELYQLLAREPTKRKTWSLLTEALDALGHNADAHLAVGALVHLEGGSELQRSTWASRQPRPALVAEGSLARGTQRTISGPVPEGAHALLAQLTSLLPKIYHADTTRAGVTQRDKIGPRGQHPVRPLLDRILRGFRGMEADLYPAGAGTPMTVLLTDPPGIAFPTELSGLTEAEQTFCLMFFVFAIAYHQQVPQAFGVAQTEMLLAAACHALAVPLPSSPSPSEELLELSRRIGKALPWLAKGRFEDAARRYAAGPAEGVREGMARMRQAGFRTALIVSDDIGVLRLLSGHGANQGRLLLGVSEEEASRIHEDLLAFWISPEAMAMRRDLGMS